MNKEERQNSIIQLIEQSNGQLLGTTEIAEHFGVSKMTVRRDLDELEQAGRLHRHFGGAVPSRQAQNQGKNEVGVLLVSRTGKYSDPFYNTLLEGVDNKLRDLDYRIAYISTRREVSTAEQIRELLDEHHVSGIILIGPPLGAESLAYVKQHMRCLVGTTDSIGSDYDAVTFDGYEGIRLMVDHLVSLGHKRLGFITGRSDHRQHGFTDAIAAHGLDADPKLTVVVPFGIDGWTRELGHTGAEQLMCLPHPPDAIICASDLIAIGAIQWMHQHNLRVPDDIAVTGFDNIDESAFTNPPLTTVHVHKQLMGELAAERIVKSIENEHEIPLFIQTPVHLVIRASCGFKNRG